MRWAFFTDGSRGFLVALAKGLALFMPSGAVLNNPVHQRMLKADIVASFFAFDPFVSKDFSSFGQEFLIQG
jgi:hypothetical protein